MKTYVDLLTLKKAWVILKEVGLASLFFQVKDTKNNDDGLAVYDIAVAVFEKDRLNDLLALVTRTDPAIWDEKELSEIVEVLTGFFENMGGQLGLAPGKLGAVLGVELTGQEQPAEKQ